MAPTLVPWHRRYWCQVSAARMWEFTSYQHLLQSISTRCFLRGPRRRKSLDSILPTKLWTGYDVTTMQLHTNPT